MNTTLQYFPEERDALDTLFARSHQYRKSATYLELLNFICKLPKLAPFNAFLVYTQHKGARYVATPAQWERQFGRHVKDEARPLVILVPFGPVAFVYELDQTEGREVPERLLNPHSVEGKVPIHIYNKTIENANNLHITVKMADYGGGLGGLARNKHGDFEIFLVQNIDISAQYAILAHELGHILAGHLGSIVRDKTGVPFWPESRIIDIDNDLAELEAESIAFIVCRRLRIKTTSEEYFAGYVKDRVSLPPFSLKKVLEVAGYIERMGREVIKIPKAPEKKTKPTQ